MPYTGKKVLLTGAAGFIGSHLAEGLVQAGAELRCLVRYNSRNDWGMLNFVDPKLLGEMEVVTGDVTDAAGMLRLCQGRDIIFHLAALIAIPYSYVNPNHVVQTNVGGTLNILEAARHWQVERLVHVSTSEVYGTARYVPMDENHPLQGQSPYSASKIGADKLVESYYRSFDIPVTTIRPFNTFGPRQSARAVIPTIISQALVRKEIKLGALTPTRDFTFVKDTVNGFLKIGLAPGVIGEVINIGSSHEISIGDLAKKIATLLGKDYRLTTEVERFRPEKSEVDRLFCHPGKAKALLGWEPETSMEEGLSAAIAWIKKHPKLYRPDSYQI
ncbi:GDP-mannose 4,6-dehydratase [Desulfobacca acetoxidans]